MRLPCDKHDPTAGSLQRCFTPLIESTDRRSSPLKRDRSPHAATFSRLSWCPDPATYVLSWTYVAELAWSWGESNPRPSGEIRPRYDHPRCIADAATPTGRLDHRPKEVVRESSFRIVSRLSCSQRSFLPSSPASVAGLRWIGPVRHFCSRCLFTHLKIRRRERTARWQFCCLPRLASLSNSGRVTAQQL